MRVIYRFLQSAQEYQAECEELREAFDRACADLADETAAPLEICSGRDVVYTLSDLCGVCDDWIAWRDGQGVHPLEPRDAGSPT